MEILIGAYTEISVPMKTEEPGYQPKNGAEEIRDIEPNPPSKFLRCKTCRRNTNTLALFRQNSPWTMELEGGSQVLLSLGAPGDVPLGIHYSQTPSPAVAHRASGWGPQKRSAIPAPKAGPRTEFIMPLTSPCIG